jgi:hypothetical protein
MKDYFVYILTFETLVQGHKTYVFGNVKTAKKYAEDLAENLFPTGQRNFSIARYPVIRRKNVRPYPNKEQLKRFNGEA